MLENTGLAQGWRKVWRKLLQRSRPPNCRPQTKSKKMAQGWRKVGARGHKQITGLELGQGRHETQRAKCCTTVVSNLDLDHSSPNFESGWGTTSYPLRVPRIWASFCRKMTTACICIANHGVGARLAQGLAQASSGNDTVAQWFRPVST